MNVADSEKLLGLFRDAKQKRLFMYGDRNEGKTSVLDGKVEFAKISSGHHMLKDNAKDCCLAIEKFFSYPRGVF